MPTIAVSGTFSNLSGFDGQFIILDPPSDSPGAGGGEVMPGPPVEWNPASPAGDVDWSFFTVAVDGSDGVNPQVRFSGRGATLVSPSFAVCAHHARGSGLGYYWTPHAGGAEVKRTCTLTDGVDYWNVDDDVGLIKLNAPITSVAPIPILANSAAAAGQPCVAIEMDRHLNRMAVTASIANSQVSTSTFRASGDAIEGGDSGKPVVCLIDGDPVLIITAIESGSATSAFGPNASHFISEINVILAASGEELTLWSTGADYATGSRSSFSGSLRSSPHPNSFPCILY